VGLEQVGDFLFKVWVQFPKSFGRDDLVARAAPRPDSTLNQNREKQDGQNGHYPFHQHVLTSIGLDIKRAALKAACCFRSFL
jgi:hypothetical protein